MRHKLCLSALLPTMLTLGSAAAIPPTNDVDAQTLAALDPTRAGRLACRGLNATGAILDARLRLAQSLSERYEPGTERMGLYSGIGQTDLPLGTIDPLARRYFEQGLALAYGFNHHAAIRSFRLAREIDPTCALCAWGEALATGPNINAAMEQERNRAALAALDVARGVSSDAPPLAAALIEAQAARYSLEPDADRAVLDKAYADAMMALARAHPALDDLAVLAAEAAMNTSPWNYWNMETGEPRPLVGEAVEIIKTVMQRNPTHPQAAHLYIHLLELPEPEKAEAAADRLRDNRPGALGHLVHMPAHIYYRLGRYEDSLNANIAAAAADEAYLAEADDDPMVRFGYYPHNVHFLLTSAQMMGDVETVITQAAKLRQVIDVDTGRELAWVQAIYAAPYFALAQYGSPASILALTDRAHPLEYVEAMRRYARAVASAQAGDQQAFESELVALTELGNSPAVKAMESAGFPGPVLVGIAGEVAQGRMELARNRPEAAIDHFTRAAEMQKSVPYMEPPFWYYPVNQSLGAAYFSAGRYNEAREAFRAALFDAPNSALALYGLAQTEKRLGHRPEARAAEEAFAKVWRGKDEWLEMSRI